MNTRMSRYIWAEFPHAIGRAPLLGLAAGLALILVSQWIMPAIPEAAIRLLEQSYRLDGLGEVVLLNDLLAVSTVLFFVGVSGLSRVIVTPREERQLDLLLSKPVPPARFLMARTAPVLGATLALGLALSATCALMMRDFGEASAVLLGFTSGLCVTAITLVQLALASLIYLRVHDGFQALLTAFLLWMAPLIPGSVYLYRPDLFAEKPGLAELTVMPANLIWLGDAAGATAAGGLVLASAVTAGALWLGGRTLARMETR